MQIQSLCVCHHEIGEIVFFLSQDYRILLFPCKVQQIREYIYIYM